MHKRDMHIQSKKHCERNAVEAVYFDIGKCQVLTFTKGTRYDTLVPHLYPSLRYLGTPAAPGFFIQIESSPFTMILTTEIFTRHTAAVRRARYSILGLSGFRD